MQLKKKRGLNRGPTRKLNRVLIVGPGNVGLRLIQQLRAQKVQQIVALVRSNTSAVVVRAAGALPLRGDLDRPRSLWRLAREHRRTPFQAVVHLAPPPTVNLTRSVRSIHMQHRDPRTRNLLNALNPRMVLNPAMLPAMVTTMGGATRFKQPGFNLVYVSTSGVYGDCAGAVVSESRPIRPTSARAQRRVDAERAVLRTAKRAGWQATVLRAPGIYDADHVPLARVQAGTVAIVAEQDSYTNHIHSDDLAALCIAAMRVRSTSHQARIYNACDNTRLKMGDWFDAVADTFDLPRPPRVLREQARAQVSPMLWSFMRESRRLSNARMLRELGIRLRYPTVHAALAEMRASSKLSKSSKD